MRFLINPLFVFTAVWLMVIFLYQLKWSDVLVADGYFVAFFVFSYIIAPFFLGYISSYFVPIKRTVYSRFSRDILLKNERVRILLFIFIIATIFEILVFRGFPLLWFFVGDNRGYADYGLPTLHGLLNAIHLVLISVFFYKAIGKQSSWIVFIFLIVWCIMMFSRFIVMIAIVQCLFLYISLNKFNLRRALKVFFWFCLVFYLFGVIGGLRSGIDNTAEFFGITDNYPNFLPPAFIWVYIYLLSPINNLVSWYGHYADNFLFPSVFSTLLPTIVRDFVFGSGGGSDLALVHESFNMSTGLAPAFIDAGLIGMLIFVFFMALWSGIVWRLSRGKSRYFSLAVTLQCIFYLVFFNPLFTLPVLFQFFIFRFIVSYGVAREGANKSIS